MSYPEESLYWKGRGMDSSQSEPVVSSNGHGEAAAKDPAKTLRDEFAMVALSGIMCTLPEGTAGEILSGWRDGKGISAAAYRVADAMMKARQP